MITDVIGYHVMSRANESQHNDFNEKSFKLGEKKQMGTSARRDQRGCCESSEMSVVTRLSMMQRLLVLYVGKGG